jgi:chromate transport protein ChrA
MNRSPLQCYSPRFLAFTVACAVVVVGVALLARSYPRGSSMRIALAAVQGIATGAVIITSMLRLRQLDELQQRVQLEALAIAFAGTGVIATAYGFLVNAGLPDIDWGALVWPLMVALWVLGLLYANRRYR